MINYRSEDFVERVREMTGGKGVKVVYDAVGKDTWERSLVPAPFGLMAGSATRRARPPRSLPARSRAKGSLY